MVFVFCAPAAPPKRFVVLIPSCEGRSAGCSADVGGREFQGQRDILCGEGRDVPFGLFKAADWESLTVAVSDAVQRADIIVLPFEACAKVYLQGTAG